MVDIDVVLMKLEIFVRDNKGALMRGGSKKSNCTTSPLPHVIG